jgi:hypothetical protein
MSDAAPEYAKAEEIAAEKKEEGVVRVCVAIPNMGYTQPESYANRLFNFMKMGELQAKGELLKQNPRFDFRFVVMGRLFTPLAREEAGRMALEADCDYLYMIDDDMICPDDMFQRLYAHNVDIVAPLAFSRNPPHKPVIYESIEIDDPVRKMKKPVNRWANYYRDCLNECDAVGFGAVLIKTDVLRAIPEPRFMSSEGTGEDLLFCYKAKKAGFRVFMDTACKIGHLSNPSIITESYVDQFRAIHKEPSADGGKNSYKKYRLPKGEAVLVNG